MCSASVAAKKGDASELSIALEFDPKSANECSTCKRTPLHLASQVRCLKRFVSMLRGCFIELIRGVSMNV